MGIQITRFIPGVLARTVSFYTHVAKLLFVQKLALTFHALWRLPLPKKRLIGELKAARENDEIRFSVGPDQHYSRSGRFHSAPDYLRAKIRGSLELFWKQIDIDEYKERYLQCVTSFAETGMHNIPEVVEEIPVVAIRSDMALDNIIVSETEHRDITAIVDGNFAQVPRMLALSTL